MENKPESSDPLNAFHYPPPKKKFTRENPCSRTLNKKDWFSYIQETVEQFSSDRLRCTYYLSTDLQSIHVITQVMPNYIN